MAQKRIALKFRKLTPAENHFTDAQNLLDLLVETGFIEIPPSFSLGFVNFGSQTPAADDNIFPWIRTTPEGLPVGIFIYYKGRWVQVAGYMVQERKHFGPYIKNETILPEGWALADGTQYPGAPDLSSQFTVHPSQSGLDPADQTEFLDVLIEFVGFV